jgi:hypothetical protein
MTSTLALPEQFFVKAEVEDDNGGNPKQEPESFHRAHLSQPAGQVITTSAYSGAAFHAVIVVTTRDFTGRASQPNCC